MTSSQERSRNSNFVLVANRPVRIPASCTTSNTLGTYSPAESCTVVPGSRLKVTPVPPGTATRRLVTIDVWLGSVSVFSTTVRALRVDAPCRASRVRAGSSAGLSNDSARGLRPSIEMAITCRTVGPRAAAGSAAGAVAVGATARPTSSNAATGTHLRAGTCIEASCRPFSDNNPTLPCTSGHAPASVGYPAHTLS